MQAKRMRTLIHKPLCALHDLLVGPRNLIRKRLDKLLDYEVICDKSSLSYEEQAVANTYRWGVSRSESVRLTASLRGQRSLSSLH